ncbi:MAG: amidohydrolase [Peptoniphilus lacydonensis]|uniref:amidohydrolase n=1 Tax=Peptoniphilus TaxID=162289 RepID=UPI002590BC28|nr:MULTISPECIES: amidohydrolase [Peptoniphilus]MDU2115954.1 amidohydrolase [Peptoniphilus lacydonensis]MDU5594546.1 amidohydrolase [Peptoniphilus rhinitidis]MDU7302937.1 amidohydrolase [Peptoniphilus lacydonensis]
MDKYNEELMNLAKDIWGYAEIKWKEYKSVEAQKEILKKYGFKINENLAGLPTAFSAEYGNSNGITIGFLGEFDALSGLSQVEDLTERKEKVKGACGHGCGHHLLGAASIGATLKLKDYINEKNLKARVIYFGTPAEEGGSGKAFMAKAGCFDNLDIAITWHPFNGNAVFTGSLQANKQVYVKFRGKGAHAAGAPHLGRSALDGLELVNIGVQFLREHMQGFERIHYSIIDPGSASPNVVQPYAEGIYLLRSKDTEHVNRLYDRFEKIVKGAALMTETDSEIIFDKACSNIIPNSVIEEELYKAFLEEGPIEFTDEEIEYAKKFRETFPVDNIESETTIGFAEDKNSELNYLKENVLYDKILDYKHSNNIMMGSSDVGDCSNVVPTAQIVTACFSIGTAGHSWQEVAQGKSSIAMKGMLKASDVMANAAKRFIENPELIKKAHEEFIEARGEKFISPIPDDTKPRMN